MRRIFLIPLILFCSYAYAETWRFTSEKANTDLVTKNPERTVEWCNEYYGTDDCVKTVIKEPTTEEIAYQEADMRVKAKERQDVLDELIAERIAQKKAK